MGESLGRETKCVCVCVCVKIKTEFVVVMVRVLFERATLRNFAQGKQGGAGLLNRKRDRIIICLLFPCFGPSIFFLLPSFAPNL